MGVVSALSTRGLKPLIIGDTCCGWGLGWFMGTVIVSEGTAGITMVHSLCWGGGKGGLGGEKGDSPCGRGLGDERGRSLCADQLVWDWLLDSAWPLFYQH